MWKTVGCRVQGLGHLKLEVPCQDNFFELNKNNVHVIALSDGAGSARLSHYGSATVVDAAANVVASNFDEIYKCENALYIKNFLLNHLQNQLEFKASMLECKLGDLAATLLLVAVCGDRYIVMHLGDGVVGYLDGEELKVASTPDNGEFANVTVFVTSANAVAALRLMKGQLKDKTAFVLMSDGTEQSLYHKPTQRLAPIIKKLMHRTCIISRRAMVEQLKSSFENVIRQQTQDDCSIVILAKPSKVLGPAETLAYDELSEILGVSSSARVLLSNALYILKLCDQPVRVQDIAAKVNRSNEVILPYLNRLWRSGLIVVSKDFNTEEYLFKRA